MGAADVLMHVKIINQIITPLALGFGDD